MSSYKNYGMENNVSSELYAPLGVLASTVQVNEGQGQRRGKNFPILATLESFDASGKCIKREGVKITAINGDVFTIQRKAFECLANDEVNLQGRLSFDFAIGDKISLYITKEIITTINDAISDLYDNGNERIKAIPTGGLGIKVTAGNVRVGSQEFSYDGGEALLTDNTENYVMLNGAGHIIIANDGRNQQYVKVAKILTQNGAITEIKQRKIDAVGGELGGGGGFKKISNCIHRNGLLREFDADGQHFELSYFNGTLRKIKSGEKTYTITYLGGKLVGAKET